MNYYYYSYSTNIKRFNLFNYVLGRRIYTMDEQNQNDAKRKPDVHLFLFYIYNIYVYVFLFYLIY